jgi:hypothetical protein
LFKNACSAGSTPPIGKIVFSGQALTSAWPEKVFHQLYQDDILIFVMRRLEQSRVYATSQQGQSLQLQYLWAGFFRFSVNLQDLKFYAHRT